MNIQVENNNKVREQILDFRLKIKYKLVSNR